MKLLGRFMDGKWDSTPYDPIAVGAFLVSLSRAVRELDVLRDKPRSFQSSLLEALDHYIGDYAPDKPEHLPGCWEEIVKMRDLLRSILEGPMLEFLDPPEGPAH